MAREIVLGNGNMIVALDKNMRIRDFFYPHVGLENHLIGHRFRTGLWTDNKFTWLEDNWKIRMKYMPETLVSKCFAKNHELNIELEINDAVHSFINVYLKKLTLHNISNSNREFRLFLSHDFHIYGDDTGDTAMYEPILNSIIHYKRKRYFLINGITDQNEGIHQFATGYKESLGREGTWKDAEDGVLGGNPIAQGAVDSVISFELKMKPQSTNNIYYWIACGKNLREVKDLNLKVKKTGVEHMLLETENYWSAWVNKQNMDLNILPRDIRRMYKNSLLIMRTHLDNDGGVIASCDSDALQFNRDTYYYVWPRDGSYVATAFDMAGFQDVSSLFFQYCDRLMTDEGFFHHKYLTDGSVGSSWHSLVDYKGQPQLPIQEDETSLIIYALWKHFKKYHDIEFIGKVYHNLVIRTSEFLLDYIDQETGLPKPSFDLWEEKRGIFTSTAITVCAALKAAAGFANVFYDSERRDLLNSSATRMKKAITLHLYDKNLGRFVKALYPNGSKDTAVDSSLSYACTCGVFDASEEMVEKTMNAVIKHLWVKTDIGGVARYEDDDYQRTSREVPGNPWFLCTLWLARWYIAKANSLEDIGKALELLSWAVSHSSHSGLLGEQLDPYRGLHLSVSPLVWSHAEFVITVCEYLNKYREISNMKIS